MSLSEFKNRVKIKIQSMLTIFSEVKIIEGIDVTSTVVYFNYNDYNLVLWLTFDEKEFVDFTTRPVVEIKSGWKLDPKKNDIRFFPLEKSWSWTLEEMVEERTRKILEHVLSNCDEWILNYQEKKNEERKEENRVHEVMCKLQKINFSWNYLSNEEDDLLCIPANQISDELIQLLEKELGKKP